jgi:putative transposase
MPQSLANVMVHTIFSTKNREPIIPDAIADQLYAYIIGILANSESPSIQVGGMPDHLHVFFALGRTNSLSEVMEEVKRSSSKWMKEQGVLNFAWQAGYGAFSVSESQRDTVVRYIRKQPEHHRKISFQQEYVRFLKKYKVNYDERYVWE